MVESPRIEYKGFKYKFNIKGDISRLLIIRHNKANIHTDGSLTNLRHNAGITIKKKIKPSFEIRSRPYLTYIETEKIPIII